VTYDGTETLFGHGNVQAKCKARRNKLETKPVAAWQQPQMVIVKKGKDRGGLIVRISDDHGRLIVHDVVFHPLMSPSAVMTDNKVRWTAPLDHASRPGKKSSASLEVAGV
jgi:hypothetical protein